MAEDDRSPVPLPPARNGAAAGEKAIVDDKLIARSVISPRTPGEGIPPTYGSELAGNFLYLVGQAADEFEPFGRNIKYRDRQLREFIPTENVFASALGSVCSRNAAFSWEVDGPPRVASRVHDILENANMGRGWLDFVVKVSLDLYCQDSGAFIETVRASDSPEAPVIAINHLDAERCYHTGVPEVPVLYQDRLGRHHILKWYEVVPIAELPVSKELLYGVQLCALSRLLRASQIIKNVNTYKYEKTGGRHTRAIYFVRGMTTSQIQQALKEMVANADAQGLSKYLMPLILGTVDPAVELQVQTLDFASIGDWYDEEKTFKEYIAQIALAFFGDYQDFAPLPGGNLGTSSQSEILHLKSRGKGPALFMKIFSHAFNQRILPKNVELIWKEQDAEQEKTEAELKLLRAEGRQIRIASGEITAEVARQIAHDEGDLDEEYLNALGGQDLTPDVRLEDDRPQEAQLGEDNPTPPTAAPPPPPEPAPAFGAKVADLARATRLIGVITRTLPEREKGRVSDFLQTRIHKAFTMAADDLAALGYMDTENRIKLSGIIGDALRVFAQAVGDELPMLVQIELDGGDARRLLAEEKAAGDLGVESVSEERLLLDESVAAQIGPMLAEMHTAIRKRLLASTEKAQSRDVIGRFGRGGGGAGGGHTIKEEEVGAFLKGSKNQAISIHATDAKSAAAITKNGIDITKNKTAALGQGFYTATSAISGRAGESGVRVAVRLEKPLVGNSTQIQKAFNQHTRGARSAAEARQKMIDAGFDGIIMKSPQGKGSADWVIGFKPENIKVVS